MANVNGSASLSKALQDYFGNTLLGCQTSFGLTTIEIAPESIRAVCCALRDEDIFDFCQLSDLCGVDYSTYGTADWKTSSATGTGFSRGRNTQEAKPQSGDVVNFAVVYHLLSLKHNCRLRIRVRLKGEFPRVDTVSDIWPSANWYEREAFDLFGILFNEHPDLRRLLTDYGFIGHPFRKDFPLPGHVEVRYDPDKKRVVYQPVTIDNRVLVPRVIRDNNRYLKPDQKLKKGSKDA